MLVIYFNPKNNLWYLVKETATCGNIIIRSARTREELTR